MNRINLLPPAAVQRFQQQRLWKAWRNVIWLATLTTASAIVWGQSKATKNFHRQEVQATLAHNPLQLRKECGELKSQMRELLAYDAQQRSARGQHSPLVAIEMLHRLKQQFAGQLQVKSFGFIDQPANQIASPTSSSSGHITLHLISQGATSCSQVMQLLRETGYFSEVSLSSSLEKLDANSETLQYSLQCDF